MSKYIVVEGMDLSGKTTISTKIIEYIKQRNHQVLQTREPGGPNSNDGIRNLLLTDPGFSTLERGLLHLTSIIKNERVYLQPALKAGTYVVSDRNITSTAVYQREEYPKLKSIIGQSLLVPDLTLICTCGLEETMRRKSLRSNDELTHLDVEFSNKYKFYNDRYVHIANVFKDDPKVHLIDTNRHIDVIMRDIEKLLDDLIPDHSDYIQESKAC